MTPKTPDLDPIRLEIIANGLRSITDESFIALMKSAYSSNIKERNDHSTAIVDAAGRLIVQTMRSPIHIASMVGMMEKLLEKYGPEGPNDIDPGDIPVFNGRIAVVDIVKVDAKIEILDDLESNPPLSQQSNTAGGGQVRKSEDVGDDFRFGRLETKRLIDQPGNRLARVDEVLTRVLFSGDVESAENR